MDIFRKADKPLSLEEIKLWLRELRGQPFNAASNFDVTAVFRVKVNDDDTYYFAGVNVENIDHRIGTHAEEGSIAAIATAFGKNAEIVEGWVMGAPRDLRQGDTHPLADNMVTCCGKCRQQIMNLADPSAVIHSISLNGDHKQKTIGELLPDNFSFRQFAPELLNPIKQQIEIPNEFELKQKIIREGKELSESEIFEWLQQLESIDYATQTGQCVIIKLAHNNTYIAGVKVEEAAFVDIDPIQNALTIACASQKQIVVDQVWSYSRSKKQAQTIIHQDKEKELTPQFGNFKESKENASFTPLTLSSIQFLVQFAAHGKIPITMVNAQGEMQTIPLSKSSHYLLKLPSQGRNEPVHEVTSSVKNRVMA